LSGPFPRRDPLLTSLFRWSTGRGNSRIAPTTSTSSHCPPTIRNENLGWVRLLPPFHWAVIEYDTVIEGSPRAGTAVVVGREIKSVPTRQRRTRHFWAGFRMPFFSNVKVGSRPFAGIFFLTNEGEPAKPSYRNKQSFRQGNFRPLDQGEGDHAHAATRCPSTSMDGGRCRGTL